MPMLDGTFRGTNQSLPYNGSCTLGILLIGDVISKKRMCDYFAQRLKLVGIPNLIRPRA